MGITAETIRVILFPSIGDFVVVLFTSGMLDLLTLDSANDTSYWEETVMMFLLLLSKVGLTKVVLLDELWMF